MNHYPHHIGDFNNATRHLTRIERSVYRDLLDLYYDTELPIPAETEWVCRRILAITEEERNAVSTVLSEFFELVDGAYRNRRCDAEIESYQARRERAKANGSKGGRPSEQKKTQPVSSGKAKRNPEKANQNQNQNQNQGNTPVAPTGAKRAAPKGIDPLVVNLFEQEFWPRYPRKEAKPKALEAFAKALPKAADGCREILEGLERAKRSEQWLRDGGQYIPHPATWLNQERWKDVHQPAGAGARMTPITGLRTGDTTQPLRGHDGSDLLADQEDGDGNA